jgi:hypothetical protein
MAYLIDNLIEGWAKKRAASVRQNPDTPVEGLENFSLEESPPATPLEAAHAVREAVTAKTGRRPTLAYWKPVAATALGISRLYAKRWQAVLDAGVEGGLFRVDTETLNHPFLVALEPPAAEVEHIVTPMRNTPPAADSFDYGAAERLPDDWVAPVVFPCGHRNHAGHGLDVDAPRQIAAREEGICCAALQHAAEEHQRINPNQTTKRGHLSVDWRVKGLHTPLPVHVRRTSEKDGGPGFPGLCADSVTGLYIGGLGNNCRHYHDGSERCVVHRSKYGREV